MLFCSVHFSSFLGFDVSRGQTEDTRTGSGVAVVAGESSGFLQSGEVGLLFESCWCLFL